MTRLQNGALLALLLLAFSLTFEKRSLAVCIETTEGGRTSVQCSGDVDQFFQILDSDDRSLLFDVDIKALNRTIEGNNTPNAFLKNPGVGVVDIRPDGNINGVVFDGGAFGIETQGHGLAVVGLAPNGKDGADRNPTGENGTRGGEGSWGFVLFESGFVVADFEKDPAAAVVAPNAAVLVQAIGGRGGKGGDANGVIFNQTRAGHGGFGGRGDDVAFIGGEQPIRIEATGGSGVRIESIGGDGGNGGDASAIVNNAFGGDGGHGGFGGRVLLELNTEMTIKGEAPAIIARSLGGAGGDGGTGTTGIGNGNGGSVSGAGNAGTVEVALSGTVETNESGSYGLIAQSIGGFSGDAGAAGGFVAYGANGESAGEGSQVTVTLEEGTRLVTHGAEESGGVLAQSIGGGGGLGSRSGGFVSLGGSGSAGGNGFHVTLSSLGEIVSTKGTDSPALHASSIGGGGGDAGRNRGVVSIGGDGAEGGNGNMVTVTNEASLTTLGSQSDGLVAQSIGGGGGSAHTTSGVVSIGGDGKKGGHGGRVTVTNTGAVSTAGDFADAVYLQSLGGGGGDGSNVVAVGLGVAVGYGGQGGPGGTGDSVTYSDGGADTYTLSTAGDHARGLYAQSLGGGGGDGGNAFTINAAGFFNIALGASGSGSRAGDAGAVSVSSGADISTEGLMSGAVAAMSQGGGGGNAGSAVAANGTGIFNFALTQGGSGAAGGSASDVTVEARGDLTTAGLLSDGVFAQSLGGGGGNSGTSVATSGSSGFNISMALAGSGGDGGSAGKVVVVSRGDIAAEADGSRALVAQSVGGGGGSAGSIWTVNGVAMANFGLSLGGDGGAAGDGGVVEVVASGGLSTGGKAATALLAQSVGGGGGSGSVTITDNIAGLANVGVSIGGGGGSAGNGKAVTVTTSGPIATVGDNAIGVLAQSVSRGGGKGGFTFAGSQVSLGAVNVGVGGNGGSGGKSGDVTLTNEGSVATRGVESTALLAQSLGGGGGQGSGVVAASALSVANVGVSVGGKGGAAGNAGNVVLTNSGALRTEGKMHSSAMVAQSIGGSGGAGGFAATGGLTVGRVTGDVQVAVGGSGGKGGQAGSVLATNEGTIETLGFASKGLFAQSVGGNGGDGGSALSASVTRSQISSFQVLVDVGGSGGEGAKAEAATVRNTGAITTGASLADAIKVQSIGGNGGSGGGATSLHSKLNSAAGIIPDTSLRVATDVGGTGGDGMGAGAVEVTNAGPLSTAGYGSTGIYAQSVGGGGGSGGSAFTGIIDLQEITGPFNPNLADHRVTVDTNVGGGGGAGGNGKAVEVENHGAIETRGISAPGIFAQSVGGGGGDGGGASSQTLFVTGFCSFIFSNAVFDCEYRPFGQSISREFRTSYSADFNIGGKGKAAGKGGEVRVDNTANIATEGDLSSAIFAQSVGGGGGIGGNGNPGIDAVTDDEAALLIDALLQGLGNNSPVQQFTRWGELTVSVGGEGGASGDGRAVSVANSGSLFTAGEHSYGIEAQSVGGGGGQGGKGATPAFFNIAVGGTGSGGGDGGDVTVENAGNITTTGESAAGIFAQSVGGGGGLAGEVMQAFSVVGFDINMGIGFTGVGAGQLPPKPGEGGDGGSVTVVSGRIETTGTNAHGVFAQSVGGSGGIFAGNGIESPGPIPSATFSGSGNDSGNGGDVLVIVDDRIEVAGESAHGVIAQSTGGKGSTGGDVTIRVTGEVFAIGEKARAVLAHSEGGGGNGDIVIEVAPGATLSTEADGRATVLLLDGADNRIENHGVIEKRGSGRSDEDYAVQAIGGSLQLENDGLLHGAFSLDEEREGAGLIHNRPGGVIELTAVSRLGKDGILRNEGTLSAGAVGKIGKARILGPGGKVWQDPGSNGTGRLWVDHQLGDSVSVAAKSDILTIHNDALLRGSVAPNLVGTNLVPSGTRGELRIVQLKPGRDITNSLTVEDTATVNYEVRDITHNGEPAIALAYEVNLAPWNGFALGPSEAGAVAPGDVGDNTNHLTDYLGELIDARIGERRAIADGRLSEADSNYAWVEDLEVFLLEIDDVGSLLDTYDATIPSAHAAPIDASLIASIEFADRLQSCRNLNEEGAASYVAGNSCAWVRIRGSALQRDGDQDTSRYTETAFGLSGGADFEIAEGLTAGVAGSYERLFLSAENLQEGSGNRFQGGVFLSQAIDQWTFSTSLSGGTSAYDFTRSVITPSGPQSAGSTPRANFLAAHARVSHSFQFETWSLEPTFDGGVHHLWRPGYSESGAEPYGIRFDDFQETVGTLNPFVKAEVDSTLAGAPIQLYGRAGVLGIVGGANRSFDATFTGVPDDGPSFTLEDDADSVYADLGVGLNVAVAQNMSMNLVANTLLSGNTRAYAGSARFNIHF